MVTVVEVWGEYLLAGRPAWHGASIPLRAELLLQPGQLLCQALQRLRALVEAAQVIQQVCQVPPEDDKSAIGNAVSSATWSRAQALVCGKGRASSDRPRKCPITAVPRDPDLAYSKVRSHAWSAATDAAQQ